MLFYKFRSTREIPTNTLIFVEYLIKKKKYTKVTLSN